MAASGSSKKRGRRRNRGKPSPGPRSNTGRTSSKQKYRLRISRLTIDKLGVRLYDKVSAVLAELIANAYDADATSVSVEAPMGQFLATKATGDKGFEIVVRDNGIGMNTDEVNAFYLKVGAERRKDPDRGDTSRVFKRKVMGRKGVGKLAPFGICEELEIISAGGSQIAGKDENGNSAEGYQVAHLILDREDMVQETDTDYYPNPGELDGTVAKQSGTIIKMRRFSKRKVPDQQDLNRQIAQRFGLATADWSIELIDNIKTPSDVSRSSVVGEFDVPTMPKTRFAFIAKNNRSGDVRHVVLDPANRIVPELASAITHEGKTYPIRGWVAYAKDNYKDDLMAGVRIYCRGKIAAQTMLFGKGSGFQGEYSIRSYFVGQIHCDWLDEEEDLIQTDRRDILWSHELGMALQEWGQQVVALVGKQSRDASRESTVENFKRTSNYLEQIERSFPSPQQKGIRENAKQLVELFAKGINKDELSDAEYINSIIETSIDFAPHVTLDRKLKEAADTVDSPTDLFRELLKTARVAELFSFGRIAEDRVRVISNIDKKIQQRTDKEDVFQEIIADAPWLIDPQWSPVTQNQTFESVRKELQRYMREKINKDILIHDFANPSKRADFVLLSQDGRLQLVEIKRPGHALTDEELDRIDTYASTVEDFLEKARKGGNKELIREFGEGYRITLVCDEIRLKGVHKRGFEALVKAGNLVHLSWQAFLTRTQKTHEQFIKATEKYKKTTAKD